MRDKYPHPFRNDSAETIPGWAVMKITGMTTIEGRDAYTVDKPDDDFQSVYLVNGPTPVKADGFGDGADLGRVIVLCDGTPAFGDSYGVKDAEWKLFDGRPGFTCLGATHGSGAQSRAEFRQDAVTDIYVELTEALLYEDEAEAELIDATGAGIGMMVTVKDILLLRSGLEIPAEYIIGAKKYLNEWVSTERGGIIETLHVHGNITGDPIVSADSGGLHFERGEAEVDIGQVVSWTPDEEDETIENGC